MQKQCLNVYAVLGFHSRVIASEYGGGMSNSTCSVTVGTEGYVLTVSFRV